MGEWLLLMALMAAGLAGGNDVVGLAAALALLLKEAAPPGVMQAALRHSVDVGVLFLILGLLLPIASGSVGAAEVASRLFSSRAGLISFAVGIASARLASDGFSLMQSRPETLLGLVAGSLAGVAFLGGIPAGPLVASGLVAVLVHLVEKMGR